MNDYKVHPDKNARLLFSCLPAKYRPSAGIGKDACVWLDKYIGYSQKWSPRAYNLYYVACGLWVMSVVAARRVTAPFGKDRFTNLTLLLVGRTGLWSKSTTAQIAKQVIMRSNLGFLLLPDTCTPEKMVSMMSLCLPEGYSRFSNVEKDKFKQLLPFIGQRGWYFDEIGMLFRAMRRNDSPMASFHGLLRKLDDTEDTYQNATVSRGTDTIQQPYLTLLGCITTTDMQNIAYPGSPLWGDGFFARYLFAVPPEIEPPSGRFPNGKRVIPKSLITPLQEWHKRLSIPKLGINQSLIEVQRVPKVLEISDDVIDGYYLYLEGLSELIRGNNIYDLDGNYIRLPEFALRFSILFASFSDSPVITLTHWDKAVEIAEEFRKSLHYMYQQMVQLTRQRHIFSREEKIMNVIEQKSTPTQREIQQYTHMSSQDVESGISELKTEGAIEEFPEGKTMRYRKAKK